MRSKDGNLGIHQHHYMLNNQDYFAVDFLQVPASRKLPFHRGIWKNMLD